MIKFTVLIDDNYAMAFKAVGHANYAEKGKDILCSAITSAINTVLEILEECDADYAVSYYDENGVLVQLLYPNKTAEIAIRSLYNLIYKYEYAYRDYVEVYHIEV
jgi:uncharacterized protein YsxB (DUF464 family)